MYACTRSNKTPLTLLGRTYKCLLSLERQEVVYQKENALSTISCRQFASKLELFYNNRGFYEFPLVFCEKMDYYHIIHNVT